VPSCVAHNHDQSLDIEYVRNIIAGFYGTNAEAEQPFEVAKRSFDRNPALFNQTFGDVRAIEFNGEQLGAFTVDLERMGSVMKPIANAIYFKEYGEGYPARWNIFVASMRSREDAAGQSSQWQSFRNLIAGIQFVAKPVPQPAIFKYSVSEMPREIAFEFIFYGTFTVYCFGPTIAKSSLLQNAFTGRSK
jgi:hypothetical protein